MGSSQWAAECVRLVIRGRGATARHVPLTATWLLQPNQDRTLGEAMARMKTNSAKRQLLHTMTGMYPGNTLLFKWGLTPSPACIHYRHAAETEAHVCVPCSQGREDKCLNHCCCQGSSSRRRLSSAVSAAAAIAAVAAVFTLSVSTAAAVCRSPVSAAALTPQLLPPLPLPPPLLGVNYGLDITFRALYFAALLSALAWRRAAA